MIKTCTIASTVILIFLFIRNSEGSVGDRSYAFGTCMEKCLAIKCWNATAFKKSPSLDLQLLFWTCDEDCKYHCMWQTVDAFSTHGFPTPQFYGKWPFVRVFGIQEPASVVFSVLNLYAHVKNYLKFKKETNPSSPFFYVWSFLTVICVHGWFWSTVFHARDTEFTEAMDYCCAFSIVLTLFYCLLLRVIYKDRFNAILLIVISCLYLSLLYVHLQHLFSGLINYGYNMECNIFLAFLTFVIAMSWWYKSKRNLQHVHLMGWFVLLTCVVSLLEIADFPPFFWIFDAHSLWHAATIPLVKLLYRFTTADCLYLKRQSLKLT